MIPTTLPKNKFFMPAVFLILALYYTAPFLMKLSWWGGRDWDLFTTIAAVPVGSLLDYGQFPFWNMYLGGGNILFHHPEVAVISPFLPLYMIFGAVVGLKLQVLICYFLGLWGSHRMARAIGLSRSASFLVAVGYFGSVHFALHLAEGHMPFTHFCFLPWFLYHLLKEGPWVRRVLLAGLMLALMILGNGAAIPLLYTLTFSGLLFLLMAIQRRALAPLRDFALAAFSGVALAAIKFVPMVVYLAQNKWEGAATESIPLSALGSVFFGSSHSLYAENFPEQVWAWHEYGAYLPPTMAMLAVLALVLVFKRRWLWLVLAGFFLALGMGDFGAFSPWSVLSHLPGFGSARCTGRSFQFVILAVAVLAGYGYDLVSERAAKLTRAGLLRFAAPAALALAVSMNMILAWPIMASAFKQRPVETVRAREFRHVVDRAPQAYENYLSNRGSLITPWLSAYHPSRGLVDAANVVHLEHVVAGQAEVTGRTYTPNRIDYEFTATTAGRMVISMGYDPGWAALDGRELTAVNSLIAFDFETGEHDLILRYRPPFFWLGLIISALSSVAAAALWRRS